MLLPVTAGIISTGSISVRYPLFKNVREARIGKTGNISPFIKCGMFQHTYRSWI